MAAWGSSLLSMRSTTSGLSASTASRASCDSAPAMSPAILSAKSLFCRSCSSDAAASS
eukprot:CAMPEP_0171959390 /NCGR_PEP_ID=MMETSP0993-20121228/147615_1 /TAXON_ID=483369 /ORGANISM="non described non described, Strain CCMP2098" /LENGTH=57 /DNA_ID=CAMNT_0012606887 /DNA_START=69 /DNA_END=238 /DNA_ORIENTATION=+